MHSSASNASRPPASASLDRVVRLGAVAALALGAAACAGQPRRFPLREPLWKDTDLRSVTLPCRADPTEKDPRHISCAPKEYISSFAWDAADNTLFRPLSRAFAVDPGGEARNVNSLDEVPDSAWFTNRLGRHPMTIEEISRGACTPELLLDPESFADATWLIDRGKSNGSSAGFRVNIPGKGKYMIKTDTKRFPERPSGASVISAAAYHAAGFYTSCEQVIYIKRSLLKLKPGLKSADNSGIEKPFDEAALDRVIGETTKRGDLIRFQASAWLPGRVIGPFTYAGTREDDPNDILPHEDRRDLRGGRLLAAWLDHFDAREQNSMDSWIADDKKAEESSPGYVRHYYLDLSDTLGSEWEWDGISRRLGYSYLLDFQDIAVDLVTLGALPRPWFRAERTKGAEMFGYYSARDFVPEGWKNEYPNPTFSRMTELDGAWMARILARFTPEMVTALANMGQFSKPFYTSHVTEVMEGRLEKILARYLTRLSPIADVHLDGKSRLCGVDLARARRVVAEDRFRYEASLAVEDAAPSRTMPVVPGKEGEVCVELPHLAADGGTADDGRGRYVIVRIGNGVATGPLAAHLYDLGPERGFRLAGIERPEKGL
jgi:hypothetical protein